MDYEKVFKPKVREMFAAHGRNPVNDAAVAVIWERVKTMPDAFMQWAAMQIADEEKMPGNLGFELERVLFPRWYSQNKSVQARVSYCPDCDTDLGQGFFYVWQRLDNGMYHRFTQKCCHFGKGFEKEDRLTKYQAKARGFIVMPAGQNNPFLFEQQLYGNVIIPAPARAGKYLDAAKAGEGTVRRDHMDELEAMGF